MVPWDSKPTLVCEFQAREEYRFDECLKVGNLLVLHAPSYMACHCTTSVKFIVDVQHTKQLCF